MQADSKKEKPGPQTIEMEVLISRYTVLLLDAYGVLVTEAGRLPGAAELIHELNRQQKPYYLLTNDIGAPASAPTPPPGRRP